MIATAPETTPESWQQLEALYHAALATRGEAREALLAHVDPELRAKVEALLANAEAEDGKLDRPAWKWDDEGSDNSGSDGQLRVKRRYCLARRSVHTALKPRSGQEVWEWFTAPPIHVCIAWLR